MCFNSFLPPFEQDCQKKQLQPQPQSLAQSDESVEQIQGLLKSSDPANIELGIRLALSVKDELQKVCDLNALLWGAVREGEIAAQHRPHFEMPPIFFKDGGTTHKPLNMSSSVDVNIHSRPDAHASFSFSFRMGKNNVHLSCCPPRQKLPVVLFANTCIILPPNRFGIANWMWFFEDYWYDFEDKKEIFTKHSPRTRDGYLYSFQQPISLLQLIELHIDRQCTD